MQAAADSPYAAATDLAEWLVEQGTPFRDAHAIVGAAGARVARAPTCRSPSSSPPTRRSATRPSALLEPGVAVTRRTTPGGAGPGPSPPSSSAFRARLAADEARLDA